jgi:hypothetical protein
VYSSSTDVFIPAGTPFFRVTSSQRVVDTAGNFTADFLSVAGFAPLLVISEAGNDTLGNSNCPDAGSFSKKKVGLISTLLPSSLV